MQRKVSPSLLDRHGSNVKSSFISTYSPEHREKTTQLTSRKQLSSSTFLDLEESKAKFAAQRKPSRKEMEYLPHANQLARARSVRNIEDPKFKSMQAIQQSQMGVLNENTLRLKAEELLFKLKVRFGSLLKEIGVGEEDAARFIQLGKVDEIILFVSDSVRKALNTASSIATSASTSISKDREAFERIQRELEQTKTKLAQKQGSQRVLKGKLKQCHGQLKELYDRVNVKEKEYSQRTTELYQLKVQMKQQEKSAEILKGKLQALEKQRNQLKCMLQNVGKDHSGMLGTLKQQKQQLALQLSQTKQQISQIKQRCAKWQQLNQHLNEQLTRWRERVDFQGQRESDRQKSSQEAHTPHTPNDLTGASLQELKKSTMSMNSAYISKFNSTVRVQSLTALEIDNTRLKLQLAQLQKEKEQLQRTLLNYAPLKMKYEQALEGLPLMDFSHGIDGKKMDSIRQSSGELYRLEMESHYKRKTEQIASEWKDKLYEIVCKYQDEIELLKSEISTLKHQRQIAEKKICSLANEKYLTQTKVIQLEKELYSLTNRSSKSLMSFIQQQHHSQEKCSHGRSSSEEMIGSNPRLLPILEEESPNKLRQEEGSDNISVFNIREGDPECLKAPQRNEDTL